MSMAFVYLLDYLPGRENLIGYVWVYACVCVSSQGGGGGGGEVRKGHSKGAAAPLV